MLAYWATLTGDRPTFAMIVQNMQCLVPFTSDKPQQIANDDAPQHNTNTYALEAGTVPDLQDLPTNQQLSPAADRRESAMDEWSYTQPHEYAPLQGCVRVYHLR